MVLSFLIKGSFRWRVLQTFFTQLLMLTLGIISSIVTARLLGPEGRGVFFFLGTVVATLVQLGNFGLHASNTYYLAREQAILSQIVGNSLVMSLLGGTILATLARFALRTTEAGIAGSLDMLDIALMGVPFGLLYLFITNLFLAQGQTSIFNLVEFVSRLLNVLMTIIALLVFGTGVTGLITVITAVTASTALMVMAIFVKRNRITPKVRLTLLSSHLSYGWKAYLAALFSFLVIRSDIYLVNYFLGPTSTGIYSLAVQIGDMLLLLPLAIGTVFFPTAARMHAGRWGFMMRVLRKTALIMFLAVLGVALVGRVLIGFLYGEAFIGAATALRLLLPGILFLSINTVLNNFLAAEGMPPIVVWAPIGGLLLNVAANLCIIPMLGINGAALVSSGTYFLILLITSQYVWNRRELFING